MSEYMKSPIALYLITVIIGGTSWIAIKFQLGVVSPEISIIYRFAFASAILFLVAKYTNKTVKFRIKEHLFLAIAGLFLFSTNYFLFYQATEKIQSGILAVLYTTIIVMNIINAAIFLIKKMDARVITGALMGMLGIISFFWNNLTTLQLSGVTALGIILALLGTYVSSLGNIVAARNYANGIPIISGTAYSMGYGAFFLTIYALIGGVSFTFDTSFDYVISLIYLTVVTSAIGLVAYLTLLSRIGPDRAGYANVIFPIIALTISTFFESLEWTPYYSVGVIFILIGNFIILTKK